MTDSHVSELNKICTKLEEELKDCHQDLKRVGNLNIRSQSLRNMIEKLEEDGDEIRKLKSRSHRIQSKVKNLSDLRTKEKNEMEEEMISSNIRYKKITEASESGIHLSDKEFFLQQTNKLDDFLSSTLDSIKSLEKQGGYIDRINKSLRNGLVNFGVAGDVLHRLESRFAGDKSLFIILICLLVLLIFILRLLF